MSNIILTTNCNRKCSYCFAKDNLNSPMHFNINDFIKVVNWLEKNKRSIYRIGFLGGEPTTHPNFTDFLSYTLSKRLNTLIFTNGVIEDDSFYNNVLNIAFKYGVKNSSDLGFLVNVNEEKIRSEKETFLQKRFFKEFGRVSTLSFNIFEESFNPMFLLDIIQKYSMKRSIRLGIAAPLGNSNKYLDTKFYKIAAKKIIELGNEATKKDIAIGFDCGFVRCMFSDEDMKQIEGIKKENIVFDCGPIIDIYPNLEITNCYPLSRKERFSIEDYSYSEIQEKFRTIIRNMSNIFEECDSCNFYLSKECDGGCKAHKAYA
jgi:radical SAM protein with 4Fe4S-binding SPASM domain